MDIITGFLDSNLHPHFAIEVFGYSPKYSVRIDAMMDTGFSGFLSLPLANCFQSGLILLSTATYILADGKPSNTLLCLGTVKAADDNKITRSAIGAISVSFNNPAALLGVEFLNRLHGKLILDLPNKRTWIEIPNAKLVAKQNAIPQKEKGKTSNP